MADFESTAGAAVTALQEIDSLTGTTVGELTQASTKLGNLAGEYRELNTQVGSALETLEERITAAESQQGSSVEALKQELAQVKQRATEVRDKLKQELSDRETEAGELDGQTEKLRENTAKLTESLVNEVNATKEKLDEANDQLETDLGKVESEIEAGQTMFDGVVKELNEQVGMFDSLINEDCIPKVNEIGNAVSDHLLALHTTFREGVDEKTTVLQAALTAMDDEVEKAQTKALNELDEAVDGVEKVLALDSAVEIFTSAIMAHIGMNVEMELSEKAYEELGRRFDELVDVFRKMAD